VPTFSYQARDRGGALIEGEIEVQQADQVESAIMSLGYYPVSFTKKNQDISFTSFTSIFQKKPAAKDIANLTRQFQVMFSAGTPIDRILFTLAKQASNPLLKVVLTEIQADVASGLRPSAAFKKHPLYFNSLYTSMLEAGETGGFLDRTLNEMAKILEKEHEIKTKVSSATLYPKIVFGVLIIVTWGMLVFVIPPFQTFYAKFGADLPLPTKILLNLSKLLTNYWYLGLFFVICIFFGWRYFAKTPQGTEFRSWLELRAPVFGRLNLLVINARFGHLISGLYRAGVPLVSALGIVANTVSNKFFAQEILEIKNGVEHGRSLSKCLEGSKYFEPMMQEACGVGEKIGKIDELLLSVAKFYDEEADDMLKNLSVLIEPFLLVVLFGAVMLLALAIYMPMWNISKVILPS
jgi:type II secretory pathway component PulF